MQGIGRAFMKMTTYEYLGMSDQMKGMPQPPLELEYDTSVPVIDLPDPKEFSAPSIPVRDAIEIRRSIRTYSRTPLTKEELSFLLWCTQGVKEIDEGEATFRTVPSAGARHALETYLLINNVEDLQPGLYRFLALNHKLVEINTEPNIAHKICESCLGQRHVILCASTFIWTAVIHRMHWRYGDRGYRYVHLDAGHACQNLYLSAETIDCGACAIAAFSDEAINALLGINGEEQFVLYLATVGKK
jgi:SagB-type dehydrogenase family enzyme